VKDFGAVGDRRERLVDEDPRWPGTLAGFVAALNDDLPDAVRPAWDFVTAGDVLRTIDASDTLDWLAFELACRALVARGGGVLHVPDGHYVTARHVNLPSDVELRGAGRAGTIIQNVWNRGVGYDADFRPLVLALGCYHPTAMTTPGDSGMPLQRYNVSEAVDPGATRVGLAAGAGDFAPGLFLLLGTFATDSIGGIAHPRFAQICRVIAVESPYLVIERPVKRAYVTTSGPHGYVWRFGTGRDSASGFAGSPWLVRENVTVRNLGTRGRSLFNRTAAWNLLVEDVDHVGRNGISHNAFVHSTLRRMTITTEARGIDTKGESFDVRFEDIAVVFKSAVRRDAITLVSVGESTEDAVFRRVAIQDGPLFGQGPSDTTAQVPRVRLAAYDTVLDDVTVTCREPGAQALILTTEHGGERTRIERLRLVSVDGALNSFARVTALQQPTVQTPPIVEARGVTLVGTVTAADNRFWLEKVSAGSFVEDVESTAGYALNGGGLSSTAVVKSTRLFTKADVRNANHAPNTSDKSTGDRVVLDSGAAVFADGPGPFDTWSYVPKVDGAGGVIAIQPGRTLRDKDGPASLRWTAAGGGTYYRVSLNPSGDPRVNGGTKPLKIIVGDKLELTNNDDLATLQPGQWAWAQPGAVMYVTVVVRLPTGNPTLPSPDPDDPVYRDAIVRFIPPSP
jgi:hypothetical protein